MSKLVIAKRYAKALFQMSKEDDLSSLNDNLTDLANVYNDSEDLQKLLADTKVNLATKEVILKQVFSQMKLSEPVQVFARYLLSKRRFALLPEISQIFKELVQDKLGLVEAQVTVAHSLSDAALKSLTSGLSTMTGKTVTVNVNVDPDILGGVVTRIGSVVIDGSLRHQLSEVYQTIISKG